MKFTLLFIITGLVVVSCKKEPHTESPLIADTIKADTNASAQPMPVPVPSDSMHTADSVSHQTLKDTVKATKKKTVKK